MDFGRLVFNCLVFLESLRVKNTFPSFWIEKSEIFLIACFSGFDALLKSILNFLPPSISLASKT